MVIDICINTFEWFINIGKAKNVHSFMIKQQDLCDDVICHSANSLFIEIVILLTKFFARITIMCHLHLELKIRQTIESGMSETECIMF